MLDRANRLVRGDDFRNIMRSGKKTSSSHLVGYRLIETDQPTRFGFVISKACGNAVRRNLLKRRLRSIAREKLNQFLNLSSFAEQMLVHEHEMGELFKVLAFAPEASAGGWEPLGFAQGDRTHTL